MRTLRQQESALLNDLDYADRQIRSLGIGHEYKLWARRESVLLEPSVNFLAMTEIGLRLIDEHLPKLISNHDRAELFVRHPKLIYG